MTRVRTESLVESREVVVSRLHGTLRDPASGRHRSLVVLAGPQVSDRRVAQLLHDAASRIERSLGPYREWAS